MQDNCQARYQWTREELITAMQHHYRLQLGRGIRLTIKVFAVLLLVFVLLIVLAGLMLPSSTPLPWWAVIMLAIVGFYWLTYDRLTALFSARKFRQRPDANLKIEWTFSADEVRIETELGKTSVKWKAFLKVIETADGFLFYSLKNLFNWVPFTAFESPQCIEKVRHLIEQEFHKSKSATVAEA